MIAVVTFPDLRFSILLSAVFYSDFLKKLAMAEYQGLLTRNMSSDIYEKTEMTEEDQRLTLAYESLDTMPEFLVTNFCTFIRILDISSNRFSDVTFLKHFKNLTALILDHNKINSDTTFASIPSLKLLWLNHNEISRLFPFVKHLHDCFPKLQQLSLMDNPGVPPDIDDTTFYQHLQYRLFTISWFSSLEHLDSRKVTQYEHEEASRLYKRPWFERISSYSLLTNVYGSLTQLFTSSTGNKETAVNNNNNNNISRSNVI